MSGHSNLFRLRVGSYRVIYTIEGILLIVRVLTIGNRGDVYK
ncbi:RelE/StbE replicon stabilization toxin [Intestinimonas butyriciproducens]|nr:RelE/StbE replicon stabilization toxin [Intestinimonas butyriciproducens]